VLDEISNFISGKECPLHFIYRTLEDSARPFTISFSKNQNENSCNNLFLFAFNWQYEYNYTFILPEIITMANVNNPIAWLTP